MHSVKPINLCEETTINANTSNRHQQQQQHANRKCCGIRDLQGRFPRMTTICCRIFLPLATLIIVSTLFGLCLAQLEAPGEYYRNDQIVAREYVLNSLPLDSVVSAMGFLPALCFARLVQLQTHALNGTEIPPGPPFLEDQHEFESVVQLVKGRQRLLKNDVVINSVIEFLEELLTQKWPNWWEEWTPEDNSSLEFMKECGKLGAYYVSRILSLNTRIVEATNSQNLTFNWIRCWNTTSTGEIVAWNPTQEMFETATNQSDFYSAVWQVDQTQLFEQYMDLLPDGANLTEVSIAWENSIMEATGRSACVENIGGTAWFWFTVMTTVGYGNQAPVSNGGRLTVSIFGFLSILAFGGVLAIAGQVVDVLYRDFVAKSRFSRILARHDVGVVIWGMIATGWMYFIGGFAGRWWKQRLDIETTKGDQMWFGFISSTTVGLGDYFLQPEVMFLKDVVVFSTIYLTGFVFTSTFLSNLGSFLKAWLPSIAPKTLIEELEHTNDQAKMEELPQADGNPTAESLPQPQGSDISSLPPEDDASYCTSVDHHKVCASTQSPTQESQP